MTKRAETNASLLATSEFNLRKLGLFFTISFVCHVVLLMVVVYVPAYKPNSSYSQKIINIDLVASAPRPTAPEPPQAPQQITQRPKPVIPEVKKKPVVKKKPKKVHVTHKTDKKIKEPIEEKRSLKRETFKPKKLVEQAIQRVQEHVEETRHDPIQGALDQLRKTIAQQGPPSHASHPQNGSSGTGNGDGHSSALDRITYDQIQLYTAECKYAILKNWAFPEQMSGGRKDLEVVVGINITANGTVNKIKIERESGNALFDDSVYRAIKKTSTLPSPPMGRPSFSLKITFAPSDYHEK